MVSRESTCSEGSNIHIEDEEYFSSCGEHSIPITEAQNTQPASAIPKMQSDVRNG